MAVKAAAGGGKGEGREGTGEEEYGRGKKTERPAGPGMTSLPVVSEGAGPGLPSAPRVRWGRCYRTGGGAGAQDYGGNFNSAVP